MDFSNSEGGQRCTVVSWLWFTQAAWLIMTIPMEIPDLGDDFRRNIYVIDSIAMDTENKYHHLGIQFSMDPII